MTTPCLGSPQAFDALIDHTSGPVPRHVVNEARTICGGCPLMVACLRGHRTERWAQLIIGARLPAKSRPFCGTERGYKAHTAHGEERCAACKANNAERKRLSVARRREREAA